MASTQFLQKAYLAYFGRPVDPTGAIAFQNSSEIDVLNAFYASAESQSLYGTSFGATQVNAIYQMLFGRDAEPAGLSYWLNQVATGALTPAGAALGILNGALNADATAVTNKLAASAAFTAALDTTAEILGYSGNAAAASARAFLQTVTATPATADAVTTAVANAVVGGGLPGSTFTLTTGVDNIVGTAGNDTINGSDTTVTGLDVVNGGDGTDTLNISDVAGAAADLTKLSVSNVENLVLASTASLSGAAADVSAWTGLTSATFDLRGVNGTDDAITAADTTAVTLTAKVVTGASDLTINGGSTVSATVNNRGQLH